MEEIRPVFVGVDHPLVFVAMRVASPHGQAGMTMVMVTIIMGMDMFVTQSFMYVNMNVTFQQEKRYCGDEQSRRHEMGDGERFAENRGREGDPDERCAGEDDLSTRGAQPLRGGDVQYDAGTIRTRAD